AAQAEMADLHPHRSQGGDETEEDEDEDLAEAHIPIGPLPSGVEPRGGHGGCADDEEPPRLRDEDEHDAGETGTTEEEEGRTLDRMRLGQTGRGQTHRTDSLVVGAADAVGVVVGVVRPDLEAESDEQREEAAQKYLRQTDMVAAAGDVIEDERGESSEGPDRGAGSDEDGRECQGQGAQPSTRDPLGGISHRFRSPSSAFA